MIKGFTAGAFDLLHAGHVLMLKEANSKCDHLTVFLQTNPKIDRPKKNKPIETLFERYTKLKACKYVDKIIVYETENDLFNFIKFGDFNIRIIGEDYKDKDFTGKELPIDIYFNRRDHDYSSTSLRLRCKEQ